jgi:hypothetical protein
MMLRKNSRTSINLDDPWSIDKLGRRKVADYLTPVVESINQPFVISLAAPFGTGKSFFLECWKSDLQKQGFHTVLFNAWETDFSQDALFAFINAITSQIGQGTKQKITAKAKNKFESLTNVAGGFMRKDLLPLIARVLTRKALGDLEAAELIEKFGSNSDEVEDLLGKFAEEGLKAQEAAEDTLGKFRARLAEAASEVFKKSPEPGKRKILIFVDELDRCRPNYAIQVLETIKHFFSVEGLVFILAIDNRQLENAIKSVYGPAIDADAYLRRFIDWRFLLPDPSHKEYANFLCDKFALSEINHIKKGVKLSLLGDFIALFFIFSVSANLSLRQIEQCFTDINLAVRSVGEQSNPLLNVIGVLSVLMNSRPNELRKCMIDICENEGVFHKIFEDINQDKVGYDYSLENIKISIHSWFLNEDSHRRLFEEAQKLSNQYNSLAQKPNEQARISPRMEYINRVIGIYQNLRFDFGIQKQSIMQIGYNRLVGAHKYTQ